MKTNLPIITFPQGCETEREGVLLFVDGNHYAHVLSFEDMIIYISGDWQIKKTSYSCPIEYIEIKAVA